MAGALGGAKLAQGFGFDLADALASDVEFLADFFERVLALAADAEAEADHFLFFGRERLQDISCLVANIRIDYCIDGGADPAVFDEVAESGFAVAADGRFERYGISGNGLEFLDLFDRNIHATADFFVGWYAAEFLFELAIGAQKLVHTLVHVNGYADGARLVRDGAGDGLTNPPGGVGRELVAAAVFELVGGAHQADVAFLNQVEQVEAPIDVFLCDRDDQAEIGFDQIFLGALGFDFAVANDREAMAQVGQRSARFAFLPFQVAAQLFDTQLGRRRVARFELLDLGIEQRHLVGGLLDGADKFFPTREIEGDGAEGERKLNFGAHDFSRPALAQFLVERGHRS